MYKLSIHKKTGLLSIAILHLSVICSILTAAELSRERAIKLALKNNPQLKVDRLKLEKARTAHQWSGRWSNPEIEVSGSSDSFGEDEGEETFEIALTQPLSLSGRPRKERLLATRQVTHAEAEWQARQLKLAHEVDLVWIAWASAQEKSKLHKKLFKLNQSIIAFTTNQVRSGEISPLDAAQAELKGALFQQQAAIAESEAKQAGYALIQLLGQDATEKFKYSASPTLPKSLPPMEVTLKDILRIHPAMNALMASSDQQLAALELAQAMRWDDVGLRFSVEQEKTVDEPEGLGENTIAGIGIAIPLPLFGSNRKEVESAQLDLKQVELEQEVLTLRIKNELASAIQARKTAYELATQGNGTVLKLARSSFDQIKAAQQNGLASLLQVQQAQEQLLELESVALELRVQYLLAEAHVRDITAHYLSLIPLSGEDSK